MKRIVIALVAILGLSACNTGINNDGSVPGDGTQVFRISGNLANKVTFRHLDAVNAIRQARGLQPVQLDAVLSAAARQHSADMSRQNRPWHFGSDGSSPFDRLARIGYQGRFEGQNVSETFEDDFHTLDAWMNDPITRAVVLDPDANQIGFGWTQDPDGKLWWVQIMGSVGAPRSGELPPPAS